MDVLLLGTGSAEGWPNPFCECSSCQAVRALGPAAMRAQSSALVDGTLLVDCGPDAPRQAGRFGTSLAGVRSVLVTHAHPDHLGPAMLLWRSWARRTEPLEVVGPPAVVAACRDWLGPADPVTLREVRAGDRLRVADYDVGVLAANHGDESAGPAVLYDVTGPDARLLYAADTGRLPEATNAAVSGAAYDLVLLELTWGSRPGDGAGHLDLDGFAATMAGLRSSGAVTDSTHVAAIHLGHGNPPPPELDRVLAGWGASAPPDGTLLRIGRGGDPAQPVRRQPRRVLVLGGGRSGKSAVAERRLAAETDVTYVATATPRDDAEWAARVLAHRTRRPAGWRTVEARTEQVPALLRAAPDGAAFLIDDIGLWLESAMSTAGIWDGGPDADAELARSVDELVDAWATTPAYAVAVSPEVGSGVVPATASGRRYRDELGALNCRLAAAGDEVWLVTAGIASRLR